MIVKLKGFPLSEEIYLDVNHIISMSKEDDNSFIIDIGHTSYKICMSCSFEQILSLWTKDEVYDMTYSADSAGCIIIYWEIDT